MVERQRPKLNVAGSNPVSRSNLNIPEPSADAGPGISFSEHNPVWGLLGVYVCFQRELIGNRL